ncbi:MAG TPA: hypothetical protein VGR00_11745, partial [Thermoanaerobaculia bacterium]|nr:hypothetical protein [Thermoanaerobaculia bacterium]
MNASKSFVALGIAALALLAFRAPAQQAAKSADVELPLSTYDQLRAAARERKEPPPKPPAFSSARLVKATMRVDLEKRRAFWEAEIEADAGGEDAVAVALIGDGSPLTRSSVRPEEARLESKGDGTRLVAEA